MNIFQRVTRRPYGLRFARNVLCAVQVDIGHDHSSPFARIGERDGSADTAAATCHQCHLSVQSTHVGLACRPDSRL